MFKVSLQNKKFHTSVTYSAFLHYIVFSPESILSLGRKLGRHMSVIIFVLYGHGPILNYKDNNLITKLLTCRDNKDLCFLCVNFNWLQIQNCQIRRQPMVKNLFLQREITRQGRILSCRKISVWRAKIYGLRFILASSIDRRQQQALIHGGTIFARIDRCFKKDFLLLIFCCNARTSFSHLQWQVSD